MNQLIARAAYQAAAKMYPDELIALRQGARVVEKSK
jgi:mRNA-degrading endonuclease HigB of HigAB toxin-antitoxin module